MELESLKQNLQKGHQQASGSINWQILKGVYTVSLKPTRITLKYFLDTFRIEV